MGELEGSWGVVAVYIRELIELYGKVDFLCCTLCVQLFPDAFFS